jgi:hypothetical protein
MDIAKSSKSDSCLVDTLGIFIANYLQKYIGQTVCNSTYYGQTTILHNRKCTSTMSIRGMSGKFVDKAIKLL